MVLNNLVDYMDSGYEPFWIPDWDDPRISFPYYMNEDGIIIDSKGCPAIFTGPMIDSLEWELYEVPKIDIDNK